MIELDENGNIPKMTRVRVYGVSGYSNNRPFQGFNLWCDNSTLSQADIERYSTFKGWACDEVLLTARDDSPALPMVRDEFRLALMAESFIGGGPTVVMNHSGSPGDFPHRSPGFLGWLTPVLRFEVPTPVPNVLVRFRATTPVGQVEGMFISTHKALTAAFNRTANFGRVFGLTEDLVVPLAPQHFLCLTDNQDQVSRLEHSAEQGTLSGFNPLNHLVEDVA